MFYLKVYRRNPNFVADWLAVLKNDNVLHYATITRSGLASVLAYPEEQAAAADTRVLLSLFHHLALLGDWHQAKLEKSGDGETYTDLQSNSSPSALSTKQGETALPGTAAIQKCPYVSKTYRHSVEHGPDQFKVLSLGFEFQSSDLFTVAVESTNGGNFTCRYATADDIPENEPIGFCLIGTTQVGLQLDASPGQQGIAQYLNCIDQVDDQIRVAGHMLNMTSSDFPEDTEFVFLNVDQKNVLYFEPKSPVNPTKKQVDPIELLKSHYESLRTALFQFHLRDNYLVVKYMTPFPSNTDPFKFNVLYLPKDLKADGGKYYGLIAHRHRLQDTTSFSYVPQVTFNCPLAQAYLILRELVAQTHINPCTAGLNKGIGYVTRKFGVEHDRFVRTEEIGFLFLLSYYLYIMDAEGKQELAIALRHGFREVYNGLSDSAKSNLGSATDNCVNALISYAELIEPDDGIHKYPYTERGTVLIEYRVFNFLVAKDGCQSENFPRDPQSVFHEAKVTIAVVDEDDEAEDDAPMLDALQKARSEESKE